MANSMDVIKVKYGNQEVKPLKEFLKLNREELSDAEQKVQEAIKVLYEMNDKDPPLYLEFPPCNENFPLMIDVTTYTTKVGAAAIYAPVTNQIQFQQIDKIQPLVVSLAHELKHAEQNSSELLNRVLKGTYESIQLRYLEEAQAYAFDGRIQAELFNMPIQDQDPFGETPIYQEMLKKYESLPLAERIKKAEEDAIIQLLPKLWNGSLYTLEYEMLHPVDLNDPTYVKKLPESFHLSDRILEKLKETPKAAQTNVGKIKQFIKTGDLDGVLKTLDQGDLPAFSAQESFAAMIKNGSFQQLDQFLKMKNAEGNWLLSPNDQKEIVQKNLSHAQKEIASKIDLIFSLKDGENDLFSETDFRQMVHNSVESGNQEVFDALIARMTDSKGRLKLERLDSKEQAISSFICGWALKNVAKDPEGKSKKQQILKKLFRLKDKNGERFITDAELAFELKYLLKLGDIPSAHMFLKEITDDKGRLIVPSANFKSLGLLDGMTALNFDLTRENVERDRYKLLSEFKSLKDQQGNPIIDSKEYVRVLHRKASMNMDSFAEFSQLCTSIANKNLCLPCKREDLEDTKSYLTMDILSEEGEKWIKQIPFLFKLKDENKVPLFSEADLDVLLLAMSQDPQKYKARIPIVQEYKKKRHFNNLLNRMSQKILAPFCPRSKTKAATKSPASVENNRSGR